MFKTARDMSKIYAESIFDRSDEETREIISVLSEKVERVLSTFSTMPYEFSEEEREILGGKSAVSDHDAVAYGMVPQKRIDVIDQFYKALGYHVVIRSDIETEINEYDEVTEKEVPAEIFISFEPS